MAGDDGTGAATAGDFDDGQAADPPKPTRIRYVKPQRDGGGDGGGGGGVCVCVGGGCLSV
jgi:hypothetical protein